MPRKQIDALLVKYQDIPFVLLSTPAGYGKTTVISSWVLQSHRPTAWLSLDKNDNDLKTFVDYFLIAIRSLFPHACSSSHKIMNTAFVPDLPLLLGSLINDLDQIEESFTIVLDDYGFIHQPQIHNFLSSLLEQPPQNVQLIIMTRRDPPLPLVSLRASGKILEIRQHDLLFSENESTTLLEKHIDHFPVDAIAIIQQKIEGWAVGLRLVTLSLQQSTDKDYFLRELKATNRHVQDYLIAEVLSRQQPWVRTLLLKTAIPQRFCAALCQELSNGEDNGEDFFHKLQLSNLFCVFLDEENQWARYHYLFRDLLLGTLDQLYSAEEIFAIHQQVADWFGKHGFLENALYHYLAAGTPDMAACLLVKHRHELINREQWPHLAKLMQQLPATIVESNPVLSIQEAWNHLYQMQLTEMSAVLDRVERLLASESGPSSKNVREELTIAREFENYFSPSLSMGASQRWAEIVELEIPENHFCIRGLACTLRSLILQKTGNLRTATSRISVLPPVNQGKGTCLETHILLSLALIHWQEGDLKNLQQVAQQLIQLGEQLNLSESSGYGYFFYGGLSYHRGELEAAEKHLQKSMETTGSISTFNFSHSSFALALTYLAQGKRAKAEAAADAVYRLSLETGNQLLLDLAQAFSAELAIRQGHQTETKHWLNIYTPEPLLPSHRFYVPQLTLARALSSQRTADKCSQAIGLLNRLETFYNATHNRRVLIEILTLQALIRHCQGEEDAALDKLELSLELAEPGGFRQIYRESGMRMTELLHRLVMRRENGYAAILLSESVEHPEQRKKTLPGQQTTAVLSRREVDILLKLSRRMSNKEIAAQLCISPETVKRHTANIYKKLQANCRRQAVDHAIDRGILG